MKASFTEKMLNLLVLKIYHLQESFLSMKEKYPRTINVAFLTESFISSSILDVFDHDIKKCITEIKIH